MQPRRVILVPLLVMMLLTLLVGGTAFQQTRNWELAVRKVTRNVSELLIINNIRWNLQKVEQNRADHPEQAQATWQEVRQQVFVLAELHDKERLPDVFDTIRRSGSPPSDLNVLLNSSVFTLNLQQIDAELKDLQSYAQYVTGTVTLSMLILGLLLTGITAYDLDRLVHALMQSRDLNTKIQEEERRRIAQDLHDGVVQELIDLKRTYSPQKVDTLINNLRRVCHNLKPQVLDDLGLAAALEFLADDLRQHGVASVQLNLDQEGLAMLPKRYELPLFRVIQELFSNIKNHAGATSASVTVVYNPEESPMLRGYVRDNGKGFDPGNGSKGMGLTGVQERIQQLGGRISIESVRAGTQSDPAIPSGSTFQFFIPVKQHGQN